MQYQTNSVNETEQLGAAFAATLSPGTLVAFRGDLGAGKTAFIRGMAEGMQVSGEVSSPTFALVHEYPGEPPLIHFDMYRVHSYDDLYTTGFFDYLNGNNILAVEWSENIAEELEEDAITVTIEHLDENSRRITIDGGKSFEYSGL